MIRAATREDLPAIVRLLADDALGATRERVEDPLPPAYEEAFAALMAQNGNQILVIEEELGSGPEVVACLQLLLLPGLSRQGMLRAQIEAVRVDARCRGRGLGEKLVEAAIAKARAAGAGLVQLTSDKTRKDAHRFYERLGFVESHAGMKLHL